MVNLIKFFHIVAALSLLGLTLYCALSLPHIKKLTCLNKSMIAIGVFALLTGSFLVYPKHFTFYTPWIQAAYGFMIVYIAAIFLIIRFQKTWRGVYFALLLVLFFVVHDAVTKTTVLF